MSFDQAISSRQATPAAEVAGQRDEVLVIDIFDNVMPAVVHRHWPPSNQADH